MSKNALIPILLIEDNQGDAHLVKTYLKDASLKYELHHVETLYEGIEVVKEKPIELVLLDLSLPDSTGFKTLSSFLEKVKNVPVIVLTGVNNEIIGNQSVKAGAQDFIVKGQYDGKLIGRAIRYSIQRFKTQLKLEETARNLELSEKRYVEAQQMAHFGNYEMDIVSFKMKWTDEIYRIFGFTPGSIAPSLSDYISYTHMEDREAVSTFFESVIKQGEQQTIEHRIVVSGRTIKHLLLQAKVYFEDITQKLLLVGGIQDITERKQAEQLILEKNISQRTSKVKEAAISDMSFHIRTPLSSIVNLVYL
ncbi:MAG: response regulator, partial [Bacteroidota bacterium]